MLTRSKVGVTDTDGAKHVPASHARYPPGHTQLELLVEPADETVVAGHDVHVEFPVPDAYVFAGHTVHC